MAFRLGHLRKIGFGNVRGLFRVTLLRQTNCLIGKVVACVKNYLHDSVVLSPADSVAIAKHWRIDCVDASELCRFNQNEFAVLGR